MGRPIRGTDTGAEDHPVRFEPTKLPGVVAVELDRPEDDSGLFAFSFCAAGFSVIRGQDAGYRAFRP